MKKNKLFSLFFTLCLFFGLAIGTAATAYADNMTITLTIAPAAYNVTLTGGGNATTSGGATTQSVTPEQAMTTVTYTANSGYKFPETSGNYTTTNGITVARTSDTVVTVSGTPTADANITVPDAAAIPTYTVSFASNGGSGTMDPVSIAAGTIYPLPACTFTPPAGQQFRAWSYNGQEYAVGTQFTINSDATFTAVWEDIPVTTYTVTVHPGANGAAGVSQNVAAPGTTITVNPVPFSGYEVASITWSSDGGATRNDITDMASFVMPAANVDVYVEFRPAGGGGGGGGSWGSWGDNDGGYYVPQRAYRLILAPTENGSAMLVVSNGQTVTEMNVYPTSYVQVYATPAPGYTLDKIIWSLIDSSASYDITQTAAFTMPAMDVVVYVTFKPVG